MSSQTSGAVIPHDSGESVDVLGLKMIFRVTKEMTGGAYSLLTNIAQPGDAGVPMHTHRDDHETMIVQRGRIVCRVGDETFSAGPGDIVHLPAGIPHGWRSDSDDEVEMLVIFSLTPDTDYERMFRALAGVPAEEPETQRALAANGMDQSMPPEFV
jgi:quercetin dioxygenase-like cupin family protein